MDVLLRTHFPGSIPPVISEEHPEWKRASREDWMYSRGIITYNAVLWAVKTFQPYKSPGTDKIFPAMLQESTELVIPRLLSLFGRSLATGMIPESRRWYSYRNRVNWCDSVFFSSLTR